MTTKPTLTYFDAPMSRGEECRLALTIAGVDFEDKRLARADWLALKPNTPFGSLPLYEEPGRPVLAQSNAILALIGRRHGLHPKDDFEAARHEAIMSYVEELRAAVTVTMRMQDAEEKKRAREQLAATYLPVWGGHVERQIGDGPFFGGVAINVVDLKLLLIHRWFRGGALDHIPATVFADFPKLNLLAAAAEDHPRVKEFTAKHAPPAKS